MPSDDLKDAIVAEIAAAWPDRPTTMSIVLAVADTAAKIARERLVAKDAKTADRVALLRKAAEGRREYAAKIGEDQATMLTQAATLETAAKIMEGDDGPLYGLLPSWRWTDEMERNLHGRPDPAEDRP